LFPRGPRVEVSDGRAVIPGVRPEGLARRLRASFLNRPLGGTGAPR
jgi:hypothetical protein